MTIRRGALLVTAAMLALAGCGQSSGSASCAGLVTYDGRGYLPTEKSAFTVGERLGTATVEACDDTGDGVDNGSPERRTGAYAIEGLDPAEGVAVGDTPGEVAPMAAR
ncbi:DUF6281 family protein [Streptomyces sp. S.PB5]|uniref:DUF6281 family protein n=1 Tax=Streptomyces sp. S.PB5 TaxID=3020844 RepID=UPI0025AF1DBC|nr:DUF6281 family protein [Streptomyces sp. S.PB5]MDN3024399.1 DUF6281 family protein [Streptomyces sp. S.PB5]